MAEAPSLDQQRYLALDPRHRIAASIGILPERVPEVTRPNDYEARAVAAAVCTRNWIINSYLDDILSRDYVNTNSDDGNRFGMLSEDDDHSSDDGYRFCMSERPAQRSPMQRATADADRFAPPSQFTAHLQRPGCRFSHDPF